MRHGYMRAAQPSNAADQPQAAAAARFPLNKRGLFQVNTLIRALVSSFLYLLISGASAEDWVQIQSQTSAEVYYTAGYLDVDTISRKGDIATGYFKPTATGSALWVFKADCVRGSMTMSLHAGFTVARAPQDEFEKKLYQKLCKLH